MSEDQPPAGISAEDWAATPVAVRELVLSMLQRLAALEERAHQTSRNSSKPPSSDPPDVPPGPTRAPSGRKPGGQPGHVGHGRCLQPLGPSDRVINLRPVSCAGCGALLLGDDPQPARHQVSELPRVKAEVTEYRRHGLTCLACGAVTAAEWPAEMPAGSFGPRAQATVGYLTGRFGVSQRDAEEVLETVFHTALSLGSISALEADVSAALAEPVAEARAYVQQQAVNNVDETSWPQGRQLSWLWINTTALVTLFQIIASRGRKAAQQVLGKVLNKVVGSDRWSAYNWLDPQWRQLCWAHLKRDFQALVDRGGESGQVGQALLEQVEQLFGLWHRVGAGTVLRADFQSTVQPIQTRVGQLLREGAGLTHDKTRRTCQNLLKVEAALWTFVYVEGVEPTNNGAERPLRRAVVWRRRSFGTQSEAGSRFVERVLTTVTTLRQQERDVLDYLTDACTAAIRGEKPPSLLPHPPPSVATP